MEYQCFFLLMTPVPPKSTLFPYTTLFRSHPPIIIPGMNLRPDLRDALLLLRRHRDRPHLDRKSTRLNSSHVEISYAVFCLKKKKYKTKILDTLKTTPIFLRLEKETIIIRV